MSWFNLNKKSIKIKRISIPKKIDALVEKINELEKELELLKSCLDKEQQEFYDDEKEHNTSPEGINDI